MPYNNRKSSVTLLREYVKQLLEVKVTINDEEFEVPDKVAKKIKTSILKATTKDRTSPVEQGSKPSAKESQDYENLLQGIDRIDPAVSEKLKGIVESTNVLRDELKILLSKKDPAKLEASLFKLAAAPANTSINVPEVLRDVARLSTNPKAGGMQIGAGEIVIRLMFENTSTGEKSNSLYDVTINNEPWHVKAGSKTAGIKMGSAKGKLLTSTPFVLKLVRMGISDISDLTEFGQKQFANLLKKWSDEFKKNDLQDYTPENIYKIINAEAIKAAVGDAVGIVWYENNSLFFATKDIISIVATTQGGRIVVSVAGKEKILSLINSQQPESGKVKKDEIVKDEK
jgi:hypothetical protein